MTPLVAIGANSLASHLLQQPWSSGRWIRPLFHRENFMSSMNKPPYSGRGSSKHCRDGGEGNLEKIMWDVCLIGNEIMMRGG